MTLTEFSFTELPLQPVLLYSGIGTAVFLLLSLLIVLATNRRVAESPRRNWFVVGLYCVFVVTVLVLSVSSFGSIISLGAMHGYPLLIHIAAAGGFIFLLPLIAFLLLTGSTQTWTT